MSIPRKEVDAIESHPDGLTFWIDTIYIKTLSGHTMGLELSSDDTVMHMKHVIAATHSGLHADYINLRMIVPRNMWLMDNTRTLLSYGVVPKSTFVLTAKMRGD